MACKLTLKLTHQLPAAAVLILLLIKTSLNHQVNDLKV